MKKIIFLKIRSSKRLIKSEKHDKLVIYYLVNESAVQWPCALLNSIPDLFCMYLSFHRCMVHENYPHRYWYPFIKAFRIGRKKCLALRSHAICQSTERLWFLVTFYNVKNIPANVFQTSCKNEPKTCNRYELSILHGRAGTWSYFKINSSGIRFLHLYRYSIWRARYHMYQNMVRVVIEISLQ